MTFEEELTHLTAFAMGIVILWLKGYIGAASKEEGKIESKAAMIPELIKIEEALTGAKIQGKLDKLDKLETIEKSLENAKFDIQIKRLDEILKLEQTKAIGSGNIEFEFHQRKLDEDRLMTFANKVIHITTEIERGNCNLNNKIVSLVSECNKNGYNPTSIMKNYNEFEQLIEHREECVKLVDEALIMYEIFLKNYKCPKFHENAVMWICSARNSISILSDYLYKIHTVFNPDFTNQKAAEYIKVKMNERNELDNKFGEMYTSKRNLLYTFTFISKIIREPK